MVQILVLILQLLSTTSIKAPGSYEWSVPWKIKVLMLITNWFSQFVSMPKPDFNGHGKLLNSI